MGGVECISKVTIPIPDMGHPEVRRVGEDNNE